jgi:beta-N-acetylhexosaminidase
LDAEGLAARSICVGFEGDWPSDSLKEVIARGVRAVILFERNLHDHAHVANLVREIKALSNEKILICVDQEGGNTVRLRDGFLSPPSMREIGDDGPARAAQTGEHLAAALESVGIDMNLAPVVDVDTNPKNPIIGRRSFGSDARHVGECSAALIRAMQAGGVAACAKHFPGHGDTDTDSHHDLPVLQHDVARLREVEFLPFIASIRSGVAAVMTAHICFDQIDGSRPATLSEPILRGLLRTELSFEGVVVSDDLEMKGIADHYGPGEAAVLAALASVDLLLVCHTAASQHAAIDALEVAIESGRLVPSVVAASLARRAALYERFVR